MRKSNQTCITYTHTTLGESTRMHINNTHKTKATHANMKLLGTKRNRILVFFTAKSQADDTIVTLMLATR